MDRTRPRGVRLIREPSHQRQDAGSQESEEHHDDQHESSETPPGARECWWRRDRLVPSRLGTLAMPALAFLKHVDEHFGKRGFWCLVVGILDFAPGCVVEGD